MTPHLLNPQGLIRQEEEEKEGDKEGECVAEGIGGNEGIYTSQTHAGTPLYKHKTDTVQKYTNSPDTCTHECAHMCVVTKKTKTKQKKKNHNRKWLYGAGHRQM